VGSWPRRLNAKVVRVIHETRPYARGGHGAVAVLSHLRDLLPQSCQPSRLTLNVGLLLLEGASQLQLRLNEHVVVVHRPALLLIQVQPGAQCWRWRTVGRANALGVCRQRCKNDQARNEKHRSNLRFRHGVYPPPSPNHCRLGFRQAAEHSIIRRRGPVNKSAAVGLRRTAKSKRKGTGPCFRPVGPSVSDLLGPKNGPVPGLCSSPAVGLYWAYRHTDCADFADSQGRQPPVSD
jgi:hypothetical protein